MRPLLPLLLLLPTVASAANRDVCPGCTYTSIAAGLAAAGNNDHVRIQPGTWSECLSLPSQNITIETLGAGEAVIDCPSIPLQTSTSNKTYTLRDLHLMSGGQYAIKTQSSDLVLDRVTITAQQRAIYARNLQGDDVHVSAGATGGSTNFAIATDESLTLTDSTIHTDAFWAVWADARDGGPVELTDVSVTGTRGVLVNTGPFQATRLDIDTTGTALTIQSNADSAIRDSRLVSATGDGITAVFATKRLTVEHSFASGGTYGINTSGRNLEVHASQLVGGWGNLSSGQNHTYEYATLWASGSGHPGLEIAGSVDDVDIDLCILGGSPPFDRGTAATNDVAVDDSVATGSTGDAITGLGGGNVIGGLLLDVNLVPELGSSNIDLGPSDGGSVDLAGVQRNKGGAADAGPWEYADTDGDGITDAVEATYGMNPNSTDSDGDGIGDAAEFGTGATPIDSDGDGIADAADVDDDGDGVDTVDEDRNNNGNPLDDDTDGDDIPDYLDVDDDGDGVHTADEDRNNNGNPFDDDTDNNGVPDYLDLDDDGDGIPSADEVAAGCDPASLDGDQDEVPDADEWNGGVDTDGDGTADCGDDDDDGDGVLTFEEGSGDPDGDGIPSYLDDDSDNDGRSDAEEGFSDDDGDGIANLLDANDQDGPRGDLDGDGLDNQGEAATGANPNNPDSDGDGVPDGAEVPDAAAPLDSDGDGIIDVLDGDDDGDGVPTVAELAGTTAIDTDGDGTPDYLDTDDDGDGIDTLAEDLDGDGNPRNDDGDCDGTADYLQAGREQEDGPCGDLDGDRLDNTTEDALGSDPENPDTDGDGIADGPEANGGPPDEDTDSDGIPNVLDTDDDGDGLPTAVEGASDIDGDGIPNFLDTDADGDGVLDGDEPDQDADCDGAPAWADADEADNLCDTNIAPPVVDEGCGCASTPSGLGGLVWWFLAAILPAIRRNDDPSSHPDSLRESG